MSYQFCSKIRYSETGMEGGLSLAGLVNYFQDSSTFHSESLGLGMKGLEEKHKIWVLSSWQIVIEEMPLLGETVLVKTWPYEFKGFYGSRNFSMEDEKGHRFAYANSLWIYMDTDSNRPVRVDSEQEAGYQLEEPLSMEYASRKIELTGKGERRPGIIVQRYHLDTNRHVNNGWYIRLAQEYLPEDFKVSQVRVEYRKSAYCQNVICPVLYAQEKKISVSLNDAEGKPYAVVEFEHRQE